MSQPNSPSGDQLTIPPNDEADLSNSNPNENAQHTLQPGKRIGKYLVQKLIGRGGMGTVYQALDVSLQRNVALKVLPTEFSQNPETLQRFTREAQLAARLQHPNVVSVFDVGRKGTIHYIAMELITGTSGQGLLESGTKLDWKEATRAIADICRALSTAHGAGLMHRDIKPGNLLWSQTGDVKLSDFGLAKPTQSPESLSITRRDAFVGTPLYMSPEQCRNDGVDARSDIYSLGATYYTLLTGKAPYNQGSAIQILFAHCSAPIPDARESQPDLPELCEYIIRKAMAKKPEDRYQDAREMRIDLEKLLNGQTQAPPASHIAEPNPMTIQPQSANRRSWIILAAACIALAAITAAAVTWLQSNGSTQSTGSSSPDLSAANSPSMKSFDPRDRNGPRPGGRQEMRPEDERDPILRHYLRAKQKSLELALEQDQAIRRDGARVMILWYDYLSQSQQTHAKKLAEEALATAEKIIPGINNIHPRELPDDKSIPLPADVDRQRPPRRD